MSKNYISMVTAAAVLGTTALAQVQNPPKVFEIDTDDNGQYTTGDHIIFGMDGNISLSFGDINLTDSNSSSSRTPYIGSDSNFSKIDIESLAQLMSENNMSVDFNSSDLNQSIFKITLGEQNDIVAGDIVGITLADGNSTSFPLMMGQDDNISNENNETNTTVENNETNESNSLGVIPFTTDMIVGKTFYGVFEDNHPIKELNFEKIDFNETHMTINDKEVMLYDIIDGFLSAEEKNDDNGTERWYSRIVNVSEDNSTLDILDFESLDDAQNMINSDGKGKIFSIESDAKTYLETNSTDLVADGNLTLSLNLSGYDGNITARLLTKSDDDNNLVPIKDSLTNSTDGSFVFDSLPARKYYIQLPYSGNEAVYSYFESQNQDENTTDTNSTDEKDSSTDEEYGLILAQDGNATYYLSNIWSLENKDDNQSQFIDSIFIDKDTVIDVNLSSIEVKGGGDYYDENIPTVSKDISIENFTDGDRIRVIALTDNGLRDIYETTINSTSLSIQIPESFDYIIEIVHNIENSDGTGGEFWAFLDNSSKLVSTNISWSDSSTISENLIFASDSNVSIPSLINSSNWINVPAVDDLGNSDYGIKGEILGLDINLSAQTSMCFPNEACNNDSENSVYIELIDATNGSYIRHANVVENNGTKEFAISMTNWDNNTQSLVGSGNYWMKVNINEGYNHQEYAVANIDGNISLIPFYNLEFDSFGMLMYDGQTAPATISNLDGILENFVIDFSNVDRSLYNYDNYNDNNSDAEPIENSFIKGTVVLPKGTPISWEDYDNGGDVYIEVWNKDNGNWVSGTSLYSDDFDQTASNDEKDVYNYTLPINYAGNFIYRIYINSMNNYQSFYYDFNNSTLIPENEVEWISSENGNWVPNPEKTGFVEIVEDNTTKSVDIDILELEKNVYKIAGQIELASGESFVSGDVCESNGQILYGNECWNSNEPTNWLGYNSLNMELMDISTGMYNYQNINSDGNGSVIDFNIKLSTTPNKYIARVSRSTYDADTGSSTYENFFLSVDGNSTKLIPDSDVQHFEYAKTEDGLVKVDWNDYNSSLDSYDKVWLPNLDVVSVLDMNESTDKVYSLNINLDTSSMFNFIKGAVKLPAGMQIGEICEDSTGRILYGDACWQTPNTNYLGANRVNFDIIDLSNGNWNGAGNTASKPDENGLYPFEIKTSKTGSFMLRVSTEQYNQELGYSQWNSYFVNFGDDNKVGNDTLVSEKKVQWVEDNTINQWLPNKDQAGFITFSDTYTGNSDNSDLIIDFEALANNVYTLSGNILLPEGLYINKNYDSKNYSVVRLEVFDKATGNHVGWGELSDKSNSDGSYNYALTLDGVESGEELIVKVYQESKTSSGDWKYNGYYIDFGADNAIGGNDDSFISENSVEWKDNGNGYWVPDVSNGLVLGDTKKIVLDMNLGSMLEELENNKMSLSGKVIFPESFNTNSDSGCWNNVNIEAIDKATGEWIGSTWLESSDVVDGTDNKEYNYELEFKSSGEYIIKVNKSQNCQYEDLYLNFGADHLAGGEDVNKDKFVNANKVQWKESTQKDQWGNTIWMPDTDKTGWLTIVSKSKEIKDIDFSLVGEGNIVLTGAVSIAQDFVVGDQYDSNDNWIGYNNIRIEAINKITGDWLGSTEINRVANSEGKYEYKLDLGEGVENKNEFILRLIIEKNSNTDYEYKEVYIKDADHDLSTTDDQEFVNSKKVNWVEVEENNDWGYKNWIPNPEDAGYVVADESKTLDIDTTAIGANEKKISGTITFPTDFEIAEIGWDDNTPNISNSASVELIDAVTGRFIAWSEVKNDNGTAKYSLNFEPEENGKYILKVSYSHYDNQDWENSYWKSKYIDFGSDNSFAGGDDTIVDESMVRWTETKVDNEHYWVPKIDNPLQGVTANIESANIDLTTEANNYYSLSGTISKNESDAGTFSNIQVFVANPVSYTNKSVYLDSIGNYKVDDLVKNANYTVELSFNYDNQYYHFFVTESGLVPSEEVMWDEVDINGQKVWAPSGVKLFNSDADLSAQDFIIPQLTETRYNLSGTVSTIENGKTVWSNLFVPNTSIYSYDSFTSENDAISFDFDNLKAVNSSEENYEYYLSFSIDGKGEYYVDGNNNELVKGVNWFGFDSDGEQLCPLTPEKQEASGKSEWDCDWSQNMTWKPNITPFTISGDTIKTYTLPVLPKITGSVSIGAELSGKNVWLNVSQMDADGSYGNDNAWSEAIIDSDGNIDFELEVKGGDTYKVELWIDGVGGYVVNSNNGTYELISQSKSWDYDSTTVTWSPLATTILSISSSTDLGTLSLPAMNTININIANANSDEEVYVSLEGIDGSSSSGEYKGGSNANWSVYPVTYSNNIALKVPNGDYRLYVYPSAHKAGVASNGNGTADEALTSFNTFKWDMTTADKVSVSSDANISIDVNAITTYSISGNIDCGTGVDCNGWVEAWSTSQKEGKGSSVNSSGDYNISGLVGASDYTLNYENFATKEKFAKDATVDISSASATNVDFAKPTTFTTVTGTLTDGTDALANKQVSLIKSNSDGSNWEVIEFAKTDESGNYSFVNLPVLSGSDVYVVAVMKTTISGVSVENVYHDAKYDSNTSNDSADSTAINLTGANVQKNNTYTVTIKTKTN
jgi:hypothetical protein